MYPTLWIKKLRLRRFLRLVQGPEVCFRPTFLRLRLVILSTSSLYSKYRSVGSVQSEASLEVPPHTLPPSKKRRHVSYAIHLKPVPTFGSSQYEYYCPRAEVFKVCSGKLCTLDKRTRGLVWGLRGAGMGGP